MVEYKSSVRLSRICLGHMEEHFKDVEVTFYLMRSLRMPVRRKAGQRKAASHQDHQLTKDWQRPVRWQLLGRMSR